MKPAVSRGARVRLSQATGPAAREYARALEAAVSTRWLLDDHRELCQLCERDAACEEGRKLLELDHGARDRVRKASAL